MWRRRIALASKDSVCSEEVCEVVLDWNNERTFATLA